MVAAMLFGGPLSGEVYEVEDTGQPHLFYNLRKLPKFYSPGTPAEVEQPDWFRLVPSTASSTGFALVPFEDAQLRSAYERVADQSASSEADALLAEINRRGLTP